MPMSRRRPSLSCLCLILAVGLLYTAVPALAEPPVFMAEQTLCPGKPAPMPSEGTIAEEPLDPSKLHPLFGAQEKAQHQCPGGFLVDDNCEKCTWYCQQAGCPTIACEFWGTGDMGEGWYHCICQ